MATIAEKLEALVKQLEVQRNELVAYQSPETADLWAKAEASWQALQTKYSRVSYCVGKALLLLEKDLQCIANELQAIFSRLSQITQSQPQAA